MAIARLEPSGCVIHKGKIQLRISMFLEPTEPYYNTHYVFVVDETSPAFLAGYQGVMDSEGTPIDQAAYDAWETSLPHIWRNNPFHNHFIFIDRFATNPGIRQVIRDYLDEFFTAWGQGQDLTQHWATRPNKPKFVAGSLSLGSIQSHRARLNVILANRANFEVNI